jgi:hypothetical protein
MAETRITHSFACSVDDFWGSVFFSADYNRELFLGRLHFDSWEQQSFEETDTHIKRVIRAVPHVAELPGPLKAAAKNGVGYVERGEFDKRTRHYKIVVTPMSMPDRMKILGDSYCESTGDKSCRRIHLATVEAKIFGIGGLIEGRIIADMTKSYDKSAEFTQKWIAEHAI